MISIDVEQLYVHEGTAKLNSLNEYEKKTLQLAGNGEDVVLTGKGPIWLYLRLAHSLHGVAQSLSYDSPVTGIVNIFNHNPK